MTESGGSARVGSSVAGIAILVLVVVVASRVTNVIFLVFIAALISVYLSAFTDWLRNLTGLPRGVGILVALVITLAGLVGIVALLLPVVVGQAQELFSNSPAYLARLDEILQGFGASYPILRGSAGAETTGIVGDILTDAEAFLRSSIVPYLTAGGAVAVEVASVGAISVYLALDPDTYREGVISLVPPRFRTLVRTVFDDLGNTLRAWISAQILSMTVLAIFTILGLFVLRVPYALAFGVFTGVAAIVPFFGTAASTLLPALFVMATGGWVHALLVVLLGAVVHLVEANIVAPLIFAQRLRIAPVLTVVSILLMATLFGVLGLLVAVPLLASVMVVVRHCLIGELYGDREVQGTRPAVLVPTAEVSAIPFVAREQSG